MNKPTNLSRALGLVQGAILGIQLYPNDFNWEGLKEVLIEVKGILEQQVDEDDNSGLSHKRRLIHLNRQNSQYYSKLNAVEILLTSLTKMEKTDNSWKKLALAQREIIEGALDRIKFN